MELFLLFNIFVIGVATTLAAQYAYAHFRPHEIEKPKNNASNVRVPPSVRERMLEESTHKFQAVLDRSVTDLQHELESTTRDLNKRLEKMGNETIGMEMQRYQAELAELRRQAESTISGAQADIAAHQNELKAQITAEVTAEKQRMLAQIDTKLSDAVASFLLETMQHNVDLGAQSAYLTAMLEEHKADFKKGIADEA